MLKIIKQRKRITISERRVEFDPVNPKEKSMLSFKADKNWNPIFTCNEAIKNYEKALQDLSYKAPICRVIEYAHTEPAKGRCKCGNVISMVNQYQGAFECDKCHQWYNLFGQELKNPDEWDDEEIAF